MQKKTIIKIIIIAITGLLIIGTGIILFLSLTNKKQAITSEEFKKIAKENDLVIENISLEDDTNNKNTDIKEALYATSENDWTIEYYVIKDEETAKYLYEETMKMYKVYQNDTSEEKIKNRKNYDLYTLKTQTSFYHVCRVDNTIISINAKDNDEKQIIKTINKLGY